jgi:Rrf2 family protein
MNSLFKVSAKNHAGMIIMSILAEGQITSKKSEDAFISLKDIAGEMGLSQKFLEEIAAALKKSKLVEGRQGPGGGYRLTRDAKKISVYEILVALEGPIIPMSCDDAICPVANKCASKSLWSVLHNELIKTLKEISLSQISKVGL